MSSDQKINPATIGSIIERLAVSAKDYQFKKENLVKFGNSETDQEFLSYVQGIGGYIKFLAVLIKEMQLTNVVELGNREGMSTLAMYETLPVNAKFTTIDIVKDQRYCPDEMFTDPRVDFVFGDVSDVDIIKKVPMDIELLFSDTIHYNFQITDEFDVYQHLLADVALFAIDDININDKGEFWKKIEYTKWDLTKLCHTSGWGIFLFERKFPMTKDERLTAALSASAKIWQRKTTELQNALDMTFGKKVERVKCNTKEWLHSKPKLHKMVVKTKKKLGLIK